MKLTFIAAATALVVLPALASAATLTGYTFESVTAPSAGTTSGPIASDVGGTGTFTNVHASSSTYSTVAGNGSTKSFSSNTWVIGDYFQFTADTTGVTGVKIQFDQAGSNTGPRDFKVQYSTTGVGGPFTDLTGGTYSLAASSFSTTGAPQRTTPPRFTFDFSSIAALNNNPSAAFRLVDASSTGINGSSVAASGTGRIDNILVGIVPEPTTLGLLGGALTILARRRKA